MTDFTPDERSNEEGRGAPNRIVGSGMMQEVVRRLDWKATPLGPIASWSETLLANVNLVLASPQPAVLMWGAELTFFYNEAAVPTLEGKHPHALGRSYRDVFREAWHLVGPDVEACLEHGQTVVRENTLIPILIDGTMQEEYWTYSLVPVYEGGRIAGVYDPYQNVTEVARAKRERDEATAELRQFMDVTTDLIVGVNRDWRLSYLNAAASTTYGIVNQELQGKKLWEQFPDAKYEGSPYVEHYERAMYEGISGSFEAYYPEPLNIWIQLEVYPTTSGIVTFSRDVTEKRRTEKALLQSEKLAAVGRLASSIAHEINNPLESVMNLIYIARASKDMAEIQRMLDTADEELRRVAVITNQTLRFHRQSSRPMDITCMDLFSAVLTMYEGKLRNAGVTVEKRKRANRPVTIFEGDIRQVLNNLISNAIDAMQTGGRLLVRSREATNWATGKRGLVLTIADTGSGMSPETLKRVFEAFYTTKGIGGTGIGLWISRDIVERHRGAVRVRSSEGRGTVFTLFLPFEGTPDAAA